MSITTKQAYERARNEGKKWWCRSEGEKCPDEEKRAKIDNVIVWRIGWCCSVLRCFAAKEDLLLSFAKNIDSGSAWERGRQKGRKQARLTERARENRTCVRVHRVIDFRHAAWLLGWFEGYAGIKGARIAKHSCGIGSGVGRDAAMAYMDLLCNMGWMNDPIVNNLLGIPSEQ